MTICIDNIRVRAKIPEPTDPQEKLFWYADQINVKRFLGWDDRSYEPAVRKLAELLEEHYAEWLRRRGIKDDLSNYLLDVLPYVSFRFFNAPARREVDIWEANPSQRKRFIDCLVNDVIGLPDDPMARAVTRESVKLLLMFLREKKDMRMQ